MSGKLNLGFQIERYAVKAGPPLCRHKSEDTYSGF